MAACGILLIIVILVVVLILNNIWRIRKTTVLLIGSLLGIMIAAIFVVSIFYWVKRYRNFAIQKHAVIFTTPVGDNPTAEIITHTSNIHDCNQSNLGTSRPMYSSSQCHHESHTSEQDSTYRSFNIIDEQQHKKIIQNIRRPFAGTSTITTLAKIEENPIINLTEDASNYNEFVNENLNPLESSC